MGQDSVAPRRRHLWAAALVASLIAAIAFLAVAEGVLVVMLNHPPPVVWLRRVLAAYNETDRILIQFMPECARYDTELGYTLRPGTCRFRNRDFDTEVRVNSQGVRDAEADLAAPEVIVLGDSFGMGWGVEDHEAFPSLLENTCGAEVLNSAISSYGTAREARLMSRLPLAALKWVIVQYNDNDQRENQEFMDRGNRIVPMGEAEYRGYQQMVASRREYQAGEHLIRFLRLLGGRVGPALASGNPPAPVNAESGRPKPSEAGAFLNALRHAPPLPDGVRVIAFEVNGFSRNDGSFAAAVRDELERTDIGEPWKSMTVLDLSAHLTEDQYLPLDEHLSVRGHQTLADLLGSEMGCKVAH
jgi:hypothetical protein